MVEGGSRANAEGLSAEVRGTLARYRPTRRIINGTDRAALIAGYAMGLRPLACKGVGNETYRKLAGNRHERRHGWKCALLHWPASSLAIWPRTERPKACPCCRTSTQCGCLHPAGIGLFVFSLATGARIVRQGRTDDLLKLLRRMGLAEQAIGALLNLIRPLPSPAAALIAGPCAFLWLWRGKERGPRVSGTRQDCRVIAAQQASLHPADRPK